MVGYLWQTRLQNTKWLVTCGRHDYKTPSGWLPVADTVADTITKHQVVGYLWQTRLQNTPWLAVAGAVTILQLVTCDRHDCKAQRRQQYCLLYPVLACCRRKTHSSYLCIVVVVSWCQVTLTHTYMPVIKRLYYSKAKRLGKKA